MALYIRDESWEWDQSGAFCINVDVQIDNLRHAAKWEMPMASIGRYSF